MASNCVFTFGRVTEMSEQHGEHMVTEYKFWIFDAMSQGIAYSMETMTPLGDIPEYVDAMARLKAWK